MITNTRRGPIRTDRGDRPYEIHRRSVTRSKIDRQGSGESVVRLTTTSSVACRALDFEPHQAR